MSYPLLLLREMPTIFRLKELSRILEIRSRSTSVWRFVFRSDYYSRTVLRIQLGREETIFR